MLTILFDDDVMAKKFAWPIRPMAGVLLAAVLTTPKRDIFAVSIKSTRPQSNFYLLYRLCYSGLYSLHGWFEVLLACRQEASWRRAEGRKGGIYGYDRIEAISFLDRTVLYHWSIYLEEETNQWIIKDY